MIGRARKSSAILKLVAARRLAQVRGAATGAAAYNRRWRSGSYFGKPDSDKPSMDMDQHFNGITIHLSMGMGSNVL